MDTLRPIGIGTSECESLSSYAQRLAAEHHTLPGQMVFRILAWLDANRPAALGTWARSTGHLRIGFNNNSFMHADAWVRALQRFTRRADLSDLTTRAWDHLFPTRGFQNDTLKWCPMCLAEDAVPYHRLSWSLRPTSVCSRHRLILEHRCAHCGRTMPVLHDRSSPERCSWCAGDLRDATARCTLVDANSFEFWSAREVGSIISQSSQWHRILTWNSSSAMRALARTIPEPTAAAFARRIGTSKLTTWYWLSGRARPALPNVLRAYYACGFSLAADIIRSDEEPLLRTSVDPSQQVFHLRPMRSPKVRNWQQVRQELEAAVKRPIYEAPSLLSASKAIGVARRTLRVHEPDLCRTIAARHRRRLQCSADLREMELCEQFSQSLSRLASAQIEASWKNIEADLKKPGLLNRRYARQALKRAMAAR